MQVWPALMNLPQAMRRAAVSMSASSFTMQGLLPPSSRVTGVRCRAAASITTWATRPLPVYMMWSKRCSSSAVVSPTPPSTRVMASGSMYSGTYFARAAEVCGVTSEGLRTTQLPAAMAPARGESSSPTG